MSELIDYLKKNASGVPKSEGAADVMFFSVASGPDAKADDLRAAIKSHKGEFCDCDPFDGKEHNYMELGGWIGDQGLALLLIGLGTNLGMWKLLTPRTMLGDLIPEDLAQQMAGQGFIALQAA